MNEYEKQAQNFLIKTKTTMKTKFLRNGKYFTNDQNMRDVYEITLKNYNHTFVFEFGQSIVNSGKAPTAYVVLACLTKTDPDDFEDFCDCYGYKKFDENGYYNRDSQKIYRAVKNEYENVCKLWNLEENEELFDIT
jgi:hypothetical protein